MVDKIFGDITTLHEVFQHGLQIARERHCLGWRPTSTADYTWITFEEVYSKTLRLGSGIKTLVPDDSSDIFCIGIYALNCVEWALTQQACSTFGYVIVPLYDTLTETARKYIEEQTELSVCLCDTAERVRNIIADAPVTGNHIKHIILINCSDELDVLRAEASASSNGQIQIHTFNEIMDLGSESAQPEKLPSGDDLHLICYTSGTTGIAKGVMITHRMIVSVISGFDTHLQEVDIKPGDYYLSFLPLAHVFEQIVMHYSIGRGSAIGFYSGDLKNLSNDILALRPTLFCAVPRVLQRLYGTVQDAVAKSKLKTWLLSIALEAKMRYVRQGIVTRDTAWDKYVLKPIQDRMGGRLRFIACGSAPIAPEIYQFCRAALGIHTFEAYGMTETCGAMLMTLPNDPIAGHTGTPLPCCQVKLIDVPDMDVSVERDNSGEICVKGYSVTKGYYKDPERTAEIIDKDGWLHTGDIGQCTERGCLRLIDRCKNMFKLSQGEYVSPEKVEMVYGLCSLVNQIFVDGKSSESFAVAICVPNMDMLRLAMEPKLIAKLSNMSNGGLTVLATNSNAVANPALVPNGKSSTSLKVKTMTDEELCQSKEACVRMLTELIKLGKEKGLKGFEQCKSILLTPHEFTVDSGLLTPTQKKVRVVFRRKFRDEVERLYKEQMII